MRFILKLTLILSISHFAFSAEEKAEKTEKVDKAEKSEKIDSLDFLDSIDYPELQVVPRASERLDAEAQFENEGGAWLNQWIFLAPGLTNLTAALTANANVVNSDQSNAVLIGETVGGISLLAGGYFVFNPPYKSAAEKVKRIKGNSKRIQLQRERLAEESLEKTANIIGRLSYYMILTNLGTATYVASMNINQTSRISGYCGVVVSLLALIFPNPYLNTWEKQKEYKHKIYAPIPQASFTYDPTTKESKNYLGVAWTF